MLGLGTGSNRTPPSNPVNMDLHFGQSNADEGSIGDTLASLISAGISNPAYSETPHPGKAFNNWYNSAGPKDFMLETDPVIAVVNLTHDGNGNATLTGAAGVFNQYSIKVKITVEDSTTTEWNGVYRNLTSSPSDTLTFTVPSSYPTTATGTITVRRAGFWESSQSDIEIQTDAGNYVNIRHIHWMQGNGNANPTNISQYRYFREFIQYLREAAFTQLGTLTNVSIDRDFTITVGLTAQHGTSIAYPEELHELRRYQIDACRYLDYAFFVDSLQFDKVDGVHITDITGFKARAIQASINRVNYTNLT